MSDTSGGNDVLTVTGNNNQFAVVYSTVAADGTPGSDAAGVLAAQDGAKVYTVTSGGDNLTVNGDGQPFVVRYLLPAGASTDNAIDVEGDGNKFAIAYQTTDGASSGNSVTVNGADNQFVVAYADPAAAGNNAVTVGGDGNSFAVAYNDSPASGANAATGSPVTVTGDSNKFVVANNEPASSDNVPTGSNAVNVDGAANKFVVADNQPAASDGTPSGGSAAAISGDGNQYVVANPGSTVTSATAVPGSPVTVLDPLAVEACPPASGPGGNPVAVTGNGNAFVVAYGSPPADGAAAPVADNGSVFASAFAASGIDLTSLLGSSPFGAFIGSAGGPPAGAGPDTQALDALIAQGPLAALAGSMGVQGLENAFGSIAGGGANPFADVSASQVPSLVATLSGGASDAGSAASGAMPPSSADGAVGAAIASLSDAAASGAAPDSAALGALLAQSPFAPLVSLIGAQGLINIFGGLGGGNGASNPFAGLSSSQLATLFSGFAAGGPPGGAPDSGATPATAPSVDVAPAPAFVASAFGGGGDSADLGSLLAQSPLAPLLGTLGVQGIEDAFNGLFTGGANPFATLSSADAASLFSGLQGGSEATSGAALQTLFGSILDPSGADGAPAGALSAIGSALQQSAAGATGVGAVTLPSSSTV